MTFVVKLIIVLWLIIFVFQTRLILGDTKSPPYFIQQPTTEEILFHAETNNDSSTERHFEIPCKAEGIPEPDYFWTKNGELFNWTSEAGRISQKPGEGTLIVGSPQVSDVGQYQCFAENIWGIATSNSVFARKIELGSFRDELRVVKTAIEGQPYNLTCQAPSGYPKPNIDWIIKENDGRIRVINNSRITVDPEGTLWFSSIAQEDVVEDIIYLCTVASPNNTNEIKTGGKVSLQIESADAKKTIQIAPVPQYISKKEETAIYDKKFHLYCIFGGNPLPNVTWYKNGERLKFRSGTSSKNNGKIIEIKRVTTSDEGNYTCEASNGRGSDPISHTVALKVLVKPRFVKKPERVINIDEKETVQFHCQATGNPAPEIIWIHNGKPLSEAPPNPRRTISDNSIAIEGLWINDTGNYGCNATNNVGYVYQDAFVNVIGKQTPIIRAKIAPSPFNEIVKSANTTEFPQDEEIIEGSASEEKSYLFITRTNLVFLITALMIIIILILAYLKKLNQKKTYVVHKQEIKYRGSNCLDDPNFQELTQPLNEDTPVVPASDSSLKADKDGEVMITFLN